MAVFGALYERVMRWSRHRHAEWYLGAMSFAESSFFPIPVDVMLAPMCMATPSNAGGDSHSTHRCSRCSAESPAMASAISHSSRSNPGYAIRTTGLRMRPRATWFDRLRFLDRLRRRFLPDSLQGVYDCGRRCRPEFPAFVLASIIGRGARFFLVAAVVRFAGVRYEEQILRNIERIGWGLVIVSVIVIAILMARG